MNKLLKRILIVCLSIISVVCFVACDGEQQPKVELVYTLVDGGYSVSLAKGSPTVDFSVEVPAEYNGQPIIEIAEKGFANRMFLCGVKIPNTIKKIGKEAFANTGITTITMPTAVEEIGAYAFGGCKYLEEVVLDGDFNDWFDISFAKGSTTDEIAVDYGYGLYSSNPAHSGATVKIKSGETIKTFTELVIPSNIEKIGVGQFNGFAVEQITFSIGLKEIGEAAFLNTTGVTTVSLPNTLETIGAAAFKGSSLTTINLGSNVSTIDKEAFYGCGLTTITIPDSVTIIDSKAFQECRSLTSINLGAGIEKLSTYVLADTGLTEISIPENITEISAYAFIGASALKKVNFSEGLRKLCDNAFADCVALETIVLPSSLVQIEMSVFYGCTAITSIDFGDGIAEIPNQTAYGCTSLKSIRINKKIGYINQAAFAYCSALTDIYFTGTAEDWEKEWIGTDNSYVVKATVHYNAD